MRRQLSALILLALGAVAAGCTTARETAVIAPAEPAAPRGVEGRWRSTGGAIDYAATFVDGRYVATEAKTGAVLAEGTYRKLGPGQVTLEYTSRVRGVRIAANCNEIEPGRLACVTSDNVRSDLVRA